MFAKVCAYVRLWLPLLTVLSSSWHRTRGGFVALSPISPQELFLQPMSSDIDASQQNLVRPKTNVIIKHYPHGRLLFFLFFCSASNLLIYDSKTVCNLKAELSRCCDFMSKFYGSLNVLLSFNVPEQIYKSKCFTACKIIFTFNPRGVIKKFSDSSHKNQKPCLI